MRRELPSPGRALDVGCGHGALVHLLALRGWDVTGVDTSRWMIDQARSYAPALRDRFVIGDAADLPGDARYALITCLEVLEHLDDPVAALAEFRERLAPGGRLIATTPNLRPLMPWWDAVAADPTHVSVHEPGWWRGAVRAAGMRPTRVSTFLSVPLLWRVHPALSCWVPLGTRAAPGVLICAERG